jgi:hypothetical protein
MSMMLTVLAASISVMFVVSVASTIASLRREQRDIEDFARRHSAF